MDLKIFGENIKKERINQKMTQEQLAEKADISSVFLSQIENAHNTPSLDTVWKLANVLSVSIDELLGRTIIKSSYIKKELLLENRTDKERKFILDITRTVLSKIKDDKLK